MELLPCPSERFKAQPEGPVPVLLPHLSLEAACRRARAAAAGCEEPRERSERTISFCLLSECNFFLVPTGFSSSKRLTACALMPSVTPLNFYFMYSKSIPLLPHSTVQF